MNETEQENDTEQSEVTQFLQDLTIEDAAAILADKVRAEADEHVSDLVMEWLTQPLSRKEVVEQHIPPHDPAFDPILDKAIKHVHWYKEEKSEDQASKEFNQSKATEKQRWTLKDFIKNDWGNKLFYEMAKEMDVDISDGTTEEIIDERLTKKQASELIGEMMDEKKKRR